MRLIALPKPGSIAQLEEVVARLHARPLDRSRPLWEYHLIEGVEGEKFAWYTKMHHACIDGAAGQAVLDIFGNTTPDDSPIGPSVADVAAPGLFERWMGAVMWSTTQPLSDLQSHSQGLQSLARLVRLALDGKSFGAYRQRAPRTRFNRAIGPHRTFTVGTSSLSEVKAVGKAHSCSVNDVFMAVCAVNLVISNVAGPRREVFIHGARMLTHYPVSIPAHGMALNITVQSYQDRLDFSLTACRDALADGTKLRDDMLSAWLELKGPPVVPMADMEKMRNSSGPDYLSAA